MELQRFEHDGLELVINTQTGEVFASQRAIGRMADKDEATIRRYVSAAGISPVRAEIPTSSGLRTAALLNEDTIYQIFQRYKPELLIQCAKAGIRLYLHQLAGFRFVPVQSDSAMLSEILSIVKQQRDEFAAFKLESEAFKAEVRPQLARLERIEAATEQLPGLRQILEDLQNNPAKIGEQSYPLKDILSKLGQATLPNGKRRKIGRQIADWLKLHELRLPIKKNGATLYQECYIPLIQFAIMHTLN